MANLEEVRMESIRSEGEEPTYPAGEEMSTSPRKNRRRRSRKRRNSSDSGASVQNPRSGPDSDLEGKSENENGELGAQPADSHKQDPPSTQEDHRIKFHEMYRREAEEYDREFIKRYDEDLNTTLIFAGLFSAVTSAFIIQVQPQLQSDPNEETAALLRVLIYKIDNTTFGSDVPAVPQWPGPPHSIVQVQAILYASLAASLFSAFLAMLGKQWLNRYASIDMRGSAIERSQNRQRKLDGIVTWYFDYVMESLPLMLQFALLLLGCALSRFLWEIDTTVASVVLGVTSFGLASYVFFIAAGTTSTSCPYQTPGANILRRILPLALSALRSTSSQSRVVHGATLLPSLLRVTHWGMYGILVPLYVPLLLVILVVYLASDAYKLARAMAKAVVKAFAANTLWVYGRFNRTRGRDPQTATLELQCISWMLQTSSDKTTLLLTLKRLAAMTTAAGCSPALVSACINILAGCVSAISADLDGQVVVLQESEELAALSALCCLHTLSHLTIVDPASSVFNDMRRQYSKIFPIWTNFEGLPSYHRFCILHHVFYPSRKRVTFQDFTYYRDFDRPEIRWGDYKLSNAEHVVSVQLARSEYQRKQRQKIPRWFLRYAHHLISQDPLPSASAAADCLSIIAMDLGLTVSNPTTLNESARMDEVSSLITGELKNMARVEDLGRVGSKRKAIVTLFPYAVWRERCGDHRMVDAYLGIVKIPGSPVFLIDPIATLFGEANPDPPNRVVTLMSPYAEWGSQWFRGSEVTRWGAAALAVSYTEEIGQSVVDALLQIASVDNLQPYIPINIWAWLKKQPPLPPVCGGRSNGTRGNVVRRVRVLGDVEILESYFLLVWSEWNAVHREGFIEMRASIREDLGGIGMGRHREVLIKRLDYVLGRLDRGLGYLKQDDPNLDGDHIPTAKTQYGELRELLLGADEGALKVLTPDSVSTESHSTFVCALPLPYL